jgi:hypothetical protein
MLNISTMFSPDQKTHQTPSEVTTAIANLNRTANQYAKCIQETTPEGPLQESRILELWTLNAALIRSVETGFAGIKTAGAGS